MEYILKTKRLLLRRLTIEDYCDLSKILQDPEVMYAWDHGFSKEETMDFIKRNITRYQEDGYGYFAVILKEEKILIGVIGIIKELIEEKAYIGVGYILGKDYWRKGYAYEGAKACMNYAFDTLSAEEVVADIRPQNMASRAVASRLGMEEGPIFNKFYDNKNMPHILYRKTRDGI